MAMIHFDSPAVQYLFIALAAVGAAVGLVVALVVIYALRPLNSGAVGLIVVICMAVFGAVGAIFRPKR